MSRSLGLEDVRTTADVDAHLKTRVQEHSPAGMGTILHFVPYTVQARHSCVHRPCGMSSCPSNTALQRYGRRYLVQCVKGRLIVGPYRL